MYILLNYISGSVNLLRTGHDTFASYGSGISMLEMVVANRLNTSTKLINSFQFGISCRN